jgi:hypothetical protein
VRTIRNMNIIISLIFIREYFITKVRKNPKQCSIAGTELGVKGCFEARLLVMMWIRSKNSFGICKILTTENTDLHGLISDNESSPCLFRVLCEIRGSLKIYDIFIF